MTTRLGKAVIALALIQTLILGWLVKERISILNSPDMVTLASEPVDPRDIFRGDYVTLSYGISRIDLDRVKGDRNFEVGDSVYVEIVPSGKTWNADAVYRDRITPATGAKLIRGRIVTLTGGAAGTSGALIVSYGIESYFVPEGQGRKLEDTRNARALSVDVALASDGEAAIKGLRIDGEPVYEEPLL